ERSGCAPRGTACHRRAYRIRHLPGCSRGVGPGTGATEGRGLEESHGTDPENQGGQQGRRGGAGDGHARRVARFGRRRCHYRGLHRNSSCAECPGHYRAGNLVHRRARPQDSRAGARPRAARSISSGDVAHADLLENTLLLSRHPRISLAHLPTPHEFLPRLTKHLGGPNIYVKRADCTGLGTGGNKTRKLEFLVGDALHKGATTLITAGAVQSNHARQTAAAAAKCGLKCIIVLEQRIDGASEPYLESG